MTTRIAAVMTVTLLLLGFGLALLALKLVLDLMGGNAMEGWKTWLLLGLLFFTAEQVWALLPPAALRLRRRREV